MNNQKLPLLAIALALCVALAVTAQDKRTVHFNGQALVVNPVRSITISDTDFSDLQFLKVLLKDNRIVLLGEQSHGEGSTFEAKARLVRFLHEEMDYDIISFESGLYDNFKAFDEVTVDNIDDSPLKNSIFDLWSDTREFQPLLSYIHALKGTSDSLMVTGFDCQRTDDFAELFLNDLKSYCQHKPLTEEEIEIVEQVLVEHTDYIGSNESDSLLFFNTCEKIRRQIESTPNFDRDPSARILRSALDGWLAMLQWELDIKNKIDVRVQNPRDLQMARNLILLSEIYPDKKIIGWGASFHFANKLELHKITDLTRMYARRLDSLQHSHEPTVIDSALYGAIPMGRILKEHFGDVLYSISFSSLEGSFGMVGTRPTSMSELMPPSESIEVAMASAGNLSFVDYRQMRGDQYFYSSALGNVLIFASWNQVFDGNFFISKAVPPSFPNQRPRSDQEPERKSDSPRAPIVATNVKRLIDSKTKQGIGYGAIYLLNSSTGVTSNLDGQFVLNTPEFTPNDKVVFSLLGYETDTLTLAELSKHDVIELRPTPLQLPEVEVSAKGLTAKEILKAAERKIRDNYYNGEHQQELFYRVKDYQEDSVVFNEEASVLVYSPEGYKSSTNTQR